MHHWTFMTSRTNCKEPEITEIDHRAEAFRLHGQLQAAETLFRQAWEHSVRTWGGSHPDTIRRLHNLAGAVADRGRHDDAEVLYRQALSLRERVLGKRHEATLTSMNNLACVLSQKGDDPAAEDLLRHVVVIRQAELGEHHPSTLRSMTNLATTLAHQEARQRKVLLTQVTTLERDDVTILASKCRLASILRSSAHPVQAAVLLHDALAGYCRVRGDCHPDTRACRDLYESLVPRPTERGVLEERLALFGG